jgi:hypothetical protein
VFVVTRGASISVAHGTAFATVYANRLTILVYTRIRCTFTFINTILAVDVVTNLTISTHQVLFLALFTHASSVFALGAIVTAFAANYSSSISTADFFIVGLVVASSAFSAMRGVTALGAARYFNAALSAVAILIFEVDSFFSFACLRIIFIVA